MGRVIKLERRSRRDADHGVRDLSDAELQVLLDEEVAAPVAEFGSIEAAVAYYDSRDPVWATTLRILCLEPA